MKLPLVLTTTLTKVVVIGIIIMPGVDVEEEVVVAEEVADEVDNVALDSAASFIAVANSELQTPKSA